MEEFIYQLFVKLVIYFQVKIHVYQTTWQYKRDKEQDTQLQDGDWQAFSPKGQSKS